MPLRDPVTPLRFEILVLWQWLQPTCREEKSQSSPRIPGSPCRCTPQGHGERLLWSVGSAHLLSPLKYHNPPDPVAHSLCSTLRWLWQLTVLSEPTLWSRFQHSNHTLGPFLSPQAAANPDPLGVVLFPWIWPHTFHIPATWIPHMFSRFLSA